MPTIDVHTHALSERYLAALVKDGGRWGLNEVGGRRVIGYRGERGGMLPINSAMLDYAERIREMDRAGVDVGIVSLTAPSVFFGGSEVSALVARLINDDMAEAQATYPERIRFLASLPWQYPDKAVAELDRCVELGAVGVMAINDVEGQRLVDPEFGPIWDAINRYGLPVLLHPTRVATDVLDFDGGLSYSIGFTLSTALAVAQMLRDGFLERYSDMKLIAAHGGGTLPWLASRMDRLVESSPVHSGGIRPSEALRHLYFDAVLYDDETLRFLIERVGEDRVLYGSDYPTDTGDMAGIRARVARLSGGIGEKILGGNAARIFSGLPGSGTIANARNRGLPA